MNDHLPPEAQYVITARCPLAEQSNYCVVPKRSPPREAILYEKLSAVQALHDAGVQTLKILGGEPFAMPGIEEVVRFMNGLPGLDYAVTTNAMDEEKIVRVMEDVGVRGLFVSIDSLNSLPGVKEKAEELWGCSTVKSEAGVGLVRRLRGKVPVLGANVIVHRGNLRQLPETLAFLTEHDAVMNVCPLIWGPGDGRFVYRTAGHPAALRESDREATEEAMEKLVAMKHRGYNLACPDEYALNLARFSIPKPNWTCAHLDAPPVLRVGADLGMMVCSDVRGELVSEFTVFDLAERGEEFMEAWRDDPDRRWCCESGEGGCYWSNMVRGEANRPAGGSLTE